MPPLTLNEPVQPSASSQADNKTTENSNKAKSAGVPGAKTAQPLWQSTPWISHVFGGRGPRALPSLAKKQVARAVAAGAKSWPKLLRLNLGSPGAVTALDAVPLPRRKRLCLFAQMLAGLFVEVYLFVCFYSPIYVSAYCWLLFLLLLLLWSLTW